MSWAMHISNVGDELIKHFEGLSLKAYPDPAHGASVMTIGWGSIRLKDGSPIPPGMRITIAQAEELFRFHLDAFERLVNRALEVDIRQHQFDALMSFAYNCRGWETSTLMACINASRFHQAAEEFLRWDKAVRYVNGMKHVQTLPGLTRRRKAERELFLGIIPDFIQSKYHNPSGPINTNITNTTNTNTKGGT